MDMRKAISGAVVLFASTLLLCGCPTAQTRYLPEPERLAVHGDFVHSASNIIMPEKIGEFRRDLIFRYDTAGLDVSAGYGLIGPDHHIVATVYVYPAPPLISIGSPPDVVASARAHLAQGEFERRKQEIEQAHPGAVLIEQQETAEAKGGQLYPGEQAVFEYVAAFGGPAMQVQSRLYLFCYIDGKWAIEYRFTYPKGENAEQEIKQFMKDWNWYGQGV